MDHQDDIIHRHAVLVVRCAATMRSKTPLSLALICLVSLIVVSHGFQVPSVRILKRAVSKKLPPRNIKDTALPSSTSDAEKPKPGAWERLASSISTTANLKVLESYEDTLERDQARVQLITLIRVGIPSLLAAVAAFFLFPALALTLASVMNDAGVFAVLSQDSSQFVQNFLTVSSLLFSILVGQTYYFMYGQQEAVYYALFNEVTEAKSLLEQVALVCQGRAMYPQVLNAISKYVQSDLKRLQDDPAVLLSARPVDDPLESIMYMTSVGVPSSVYETVRSLRQARAGRLGALQRKLPPIHLLLLWVLAAIELVSFPLLGAGTQTIGGYRILTVEGCLFGVTTFGIVMTLRVVGELWRPAGGAYNVDGVLRVMVSGLEDELKARLSGSKVYAAISKSPSSPMGTSAAIPVQSEALSLNSTVTSVNQNGASPQSPPSNPPSLPVKNQGADLIFLLRGSKRVAKWLGRKAIRRGKERT